MIGKTISHYKIIEKLGSGGMGVVYKAQDTKLDRFVALKFLPQNLNQAEQEKQRFIHEAKAASALDHNNICTIYEIGEAEDGQLFIAMALYDGQTLDEKIERGPVTLDETVDIALQISEGLAEAHSKEIVHRDLKPANVMLTEAGVVKILDFGLAKLRGQTKLTKEGTTLGTAAYMSPEQAQGAEVDQRTDIFSLGVLLYEMVTGQQPFKGDYEQAVTYSILHEDPEPITGLRTGVPMKLEQAVFKCVQKSPNDRYQSASELLVDLRMLRRGLDGSQSKSVATATARGEEASGKSRRGLYALGAIGIAGLVALFIYFQKNIDPKPIRLTNPQKITQAIGQESWPTWSQDGSKIAYQSNQGGGWDIYVKQLAGGEPINLTQQLEGSFERASWSPGGSQIAFIKRRSSGISRSRRSAVWIVPAIGGTATRVATASSKSNPAWSPDGTELAYMVKDSFAIPSAEIYSFVTHDKRKIALPGEEFERLDLSWSPQGDFFSYADAVNLYPMGAASTLRLVRIRDGIGIQISSKEHYELFPSWSHNGRLLYFISTRGGTPDLWQVKLNEEGDVDGELTQVTNGLNIESFAFSRDHTKVALTKTERRSNLWRIAIPGPDVPAAKWTNAKQLTFESSIVSGPDLSPDSKRIYFMSRRSGHSDIWSMPAEGGEMRQLTTTPERDDSPSLSPAGSTLTFTSKRSGKVEIWTMPTAGGPAKQITRDQSPKWWPTWSPDGQTLAYTFQDSTSKLNLSVVAVQGGEPQLIASGPGSTFNVLWWPDGQSLVSVYRSPDLKQRRLIRFPLADGPSEPLTGLEVDVVTDGLRWSADSTEIYFMSRHSERVRHIWSLAVADGSVRQLTDLQGRSGRLGRFFTNDGTYLYFTWEEESGDIWVMDVERE